eukprot:937415-Pelagomonas_calceolata.AAC.4
MEVANQELREQIVVPGWSSGTFWGDLRPGERPESSTFHHFSVKMMFYGIIMVTMVGLEKEHRGRAYPGIQGSCGGLVKGEGVGNGVCFGPITVYGSQAGHTLHVAWAIGDRFL